MPIRTEEEILAHLDNEHIRAAAEVAAAGLATGCAAVLELTPGDATCYKIVVVPPSTGVWTRDGILPRKYYWVSLLHLGGGYEWGGGHMGSDYVGSKWCHDHFWTSVVLTAFLNALSDAIKTEAAAPL
jgi:hypothetical protein